MIKNLKFVKYIISGILNTIICLGLYKIMLLCGFNYLFASSIMYIYGIVEGYILNSIIVFKHQICFRVLIKYSGVYCISFLINFILMYLLGYNFSINKFYSQMIVTLILTIFNYQLIRVVVFRFGTTDEK